MDSDWHILQLFDKDQSYWERNPLPPAFAIHDTQIGSTVREASAYVSIRFVTFDFRALAHRVNN